LGLLLLATVGCATQPDLGRATATPSAPVPLKAPTPPKALLSARVGVEFLDVGRSALAERGLLSPLPPRIAAPETERELGEAAERSGQGRVRVEPARPVSPPPETAWLHEPAEQPSELPWLSKEALLRVEDPAERLTLHFLNEMIGQDRRRVAREFGAPILFNGWRHLTPSQGLETHLDLMDREDQALMLSEESRHLVRYPLRAALRKSRLLAPVVEVLEDVKASIPFTREYQERSGKSLGRFSLKLRRDNENPFEIAYGISGWRIGSGPGRARLGYEAWLTPQWLIGVRTTYEYELGELDTSANLQFRVSEDTRVNFLVGDRVDIVTGSAMYPVIRSPVSLEAVDNSKGVLFYVEHLF
jgi:hypothetical protein